MRKIQHLSGRYLIMTQCVTTYDAVKICLRVCRAQHEQINYELLFVFCGRNKNAITVTVLRLFD